MIVFVKNAGFSSNYFKRQKKSCSDCHQLLEKGQGHCILLLEKVLPEYLLCDSCFQRSDLSAQRYLPQEVMFENNSFFKAWLNSYKKLGDYRLGQVMSRELKNIYQKYSDYEWLILPESNFAYKQRGFHATALLLEMATIPYHLPLSYKEESSLSSEVISLSAPIKEVFDTHNSSQWETGKKWIIFHDVNNDGAGLNEVREELLMIYDYYDLSQPELVNLVLARED